MNIHYASDPPEGDPGIATFRATGLEHAAVLDLDDFLWVRPLKDNTAPFRLLTVKQAANCDFVPYLANEHGWHCDLGNYDLFCVDCLRDAQAHDDIHGD